METQLYQVQREKCRVQSEDGCGLHLGVGLDGEKE
jgi:hypothetical protein